MRRFSLQHPLRTFFLFQYLLAFRRTLPLHHNHYLSFIRRLTFQPPELVQNFCSLLVQVQRLAFRTGLDGKSAHASRSGGFLSQLNILYIANGQRLDAHHLPHGFPPPCDFPLRKTLREILKPLQNKFLLCVWRPLSPTEALLVEQCFPILT